MGDGTRLALVVLGLLLAVVGLVAMLVLMAEGIRDGGASFVLCVCGAALAGAAALGDDSAGRVIGRRR